MRPIASPHLYPRFTGQKAAPQYLFISDLDGTALGKKLKQLQTTVGKKHGTLVWSTGRMPKDVMSIPDLGEPKYTVVLNGCAIYKGLPTPGKHPLAPWKKRLETSGYSKAFVRKTANQLNRSYRFHLKSQSIPSPFNYRLIISLDEYNARKTEFSAFKAALDEVGAQSGKFQVLLHRSVRTPDMMITFVPIPANKGNVARFLMELEGVSPEQTIVAGDDIIDIPMMEDDGRYIIAPGDKPEMLAHIKTLPATKLYAQTRPQTDCSQVVLEGFNRFSGIILNALRQILPKKTA